MKALCLLPLAHSRAINDLSLAVRSAGGAFELCSSEQALRDSLLAATVRRRTILVLSQEDVDTVLRLSTDFPECLIVLVLRDKLLSMDKRLRDCLPIHSFVATSNDELDPSDFLTLFEKLKTKEIFGVRRYLKSAAELSRFEIFDRRDKVDALDRVAHAVRYLGSGESGSGSRYAQYAQRAAELVDELILNAIFNANTRFQKASRGDDFTLDPTESIRLEWGYDGDIFGISIRDQFGVLTKETILKYLDDTLEGGDIAGRRSAGIGLRCVFERLHKFVVNVHPDFLTEIVCLMRFDRRLRDFDERPRSFHFFTI